MTPSEKATEILDMIELVIPFMPLPREGSVRDAVVRLRQISKRWKEAKADGKRDVFFSY